MSGDSSTTTTTQPLSIAEILALGKADPCAAADALDGLIAEIEMNGGQMTRKVQTPDGSLTEWDNSKPDLNALRARLAVYANRCALKQGHSTELVKRAAFKVNCLGRL